MSVSDWLKEIGLDQYATIFEENAIDLETLPELTDDDLVSIGVLLGHRKKILKAIDRLGAEEPAPVVDPQPMSQPPGERRPVTVLFADLSGYTRLSATLDPEETHQLLNSYFNAVDAIIEDHGGRVDKHIGDCVMAVFGAPVAHSNDPERALRAAAEIHRAMDRLSEQSGHALSAHLGIASGRVVASQTGSNRHVEYTVTGDTVNLASRLDDLARPGETLVSDAVHRAVAPIANFEARGGVKIKGLEVPISAWVFDSFRETLPDNKASIFVGREAERRQLNAISESVLSEQSGQIVLLRGEAGIGKTRLVNEFLMQAETSGFVPHIVHIVDFGALRGTRVLRDLVAGLLALPANAEETERLRVYEKLASENFVARENAVFLYDLLDLPLPDHLQASYAEMNNEARVSGIKRTLGALASSQSSNAPRLIVVEDVHWADRTTLDALTGLAGDLRRCPSMFLLTSRIEGWTLSQDFVSSLRGCPFTVMELQPLQQEDATRLAGAFVQDSRIDLAPLVERADGNPLFLEQIMGSISEDRHFELPDSIHALVLARIDRLSKQDRNAILAASVLGNRFELAALRYLIGSASYDCRSLVTHKLLRIEDEEYVFSHALIRDGTNASLLRDRRRELHLRAAEFYRDCDLTLHAEHLDRGNAPEAGAALLAAATEATERVRYESAFHLAMRAAEIGSGSVLYQAQMLLGDLSRRLGKSREMIAAYRAACDVAQDNAERCRALLGIAEGLRIIEVQDELLRTLDEAGRAASSLPLPKEQARICQLQGGVHFTRGNIEACLCENKRSLDFAREAGSRELEAQAYGNLGDAEFAAGRMISAHERFDQCLSLSRDYGFENVIAANLSMRGQTLLYLCRPRDALADCKAALKLARKLFNPRAEVVALLVGVYILELTDTVVARDWARTGIEAANRIGATRFEHVFREYLGRISAMEGDAKEAEQLVASAVESFRQSESNMLFLGGRALGSLALVSDTADRRRTLLKEGEDLLAKGVGAHNPLWFYRDAIEVSLDLEDWDEAERYARCLESYTSAQPLPWSHFFSARGRVLAKAGRGEVVTGELRAFVENACSIGFAKTVARIERFL